MPPIDPASFWHGLETRDSEVLPELTGRHLWRLVDDAAAVIAARGDRPLAFKVGNDANSVVGLLAGLRAGVPILVLGPDLPMADIERACTLACVDAVMNIDGEAVVTGIGKSSDHPIPGDLILMSSGSTGIPKPVGRTLASLLKEGERYRALLSLSSEDTVLLPVPLAHSYALGWLFACLVSHASAVVVPPTALGATAAHMAGRATIVALTPSLARLLAHRPQPPGCGTDFSRLRCVMVGAGPVDEELDRAFRSAFGIGLARNYGSTETGALFAGPQGLPPACIGSAMPGVRYRILDETGRPAQPGVRGLLEVELPQGWYSMGDIVVSDGEGLIVVAGRQSQSVRRGDRWVSPAEVEAVLRTCPGVDDVAVRAGRGRSGDQRLIAEVVPHPDHPVSKRTVLEFLGKRLAAYKLPDSIHLRRSVRRSASGKPTAFPAYVVGTAADLGAASRAYKQAELLFALIAEGVFADLDGTTDLEEIAYRRNLSLDALEFAMHTAERLGLVRQAADGPSSGATASPFLALEAMLSRSLVTRDTLADALRHGLVERSFERVPLPDGLVDRYAAAMHGAPARARTLLALRAVAPRPGSRMLEVSAGPGRYCMECLRRDRSLEATLLQIGRLCPPLAQGASFATITAPPADAYDFVVVANGIHGPAPGGNLEWLLARVVPGGTLLVDDLFLPEDGTAAEIALDWLTHGGIAYPMLAELLQALSQAGWRAKTLPTPADPLHTILIAQKETP